MPPSRDPNRIQTFTVRLLLAAVLVVLGSGQALSQSLETAVHATSNVVVNGTTERYELSITNEGANSLTDVVGTVVIPTAFRSFSEQDNLDCPGSGCDPGEIGTWTIGPLGAGETTTLAFSASGAAEATGDYTLSLTASAPGQSDSQTDLTLALREEHGLATKLVADPGPAVAGSEFRYVLSYSNRGTVTAANTTLTFDVPAQSTFVSASDGGVHSGGSVSWDLQALSPEVGGQVEVIVAVDENPSTGAVLDGVATIDSAGGPSLSSSTATPVRSLPTALHMEYGFARNTIEPGGRFTFFFTAANQGDVLLTDVVAEVMLPSHINTIRNIVGETNFSCPGSACEQNEIGVWTVGTLAPGASTTLIVEGSLLNNTPAGAILSSRLLANSSENVQVMAGQDLIADSTPLLRLHLAGDPGPAVAGQDFTYRIHVGNIGETTPTNPELRLRLPQGVSFISDTAGGSHSDGVVTWTLGPVATDSGRELEVLVSIDAALEEGEVLRAIAELDSGISNEFDLQAAYLLPVASQPDLHIEYTVDRSSSGLNWNTIYSLTASNLGDVQISDVVAQFVVPPYLQTFGAVHIFGEGTLQCPGTNCEDTELATWTIGVLEPGQSRTVQFRTSPTGSPPAAELLPSPLLASSSEGIQISADRTLIYDATPLFILEVAPETGPAVAGDEFRYTLSYGNLGDATPAASDLTFALPAATSFVSATDGGTFNAIENTVVWDLAPLPPDAGGQVELVLVVDEDAAEGATLEAVASIDPGAGSDYVLSSTAVSHVRNMPADLDIQYAFAQNSVEPGGRYTLTLTAANHGEIQLSDVVAEVLLPGAISTVSSIFGETGFSCPGSACEQNEIGVWDIGILAPGEFTSIILEGAVRADAGHATVLSSRLSAFSSENIQVLAGSDVSVDGSPLLRLHLAGDPGPAVAGNDYAYQIHIGNIGETTPTTPELRLRLPDGVTFVSDTGGGSHADGVVTWNLGSIPTDSGREIEVIVGIDPAFEEGDLLRAIAELDSNISNEFDLQASHIIAVAPRPDLQIEYTVDRSSSGLSWNTIYSVTASNRGDVQLTDVVAQFVVPRYLQAFGPGQTLGEGELGCAGSNCENTELATWTVGVLQPGQTRTVQFRTHPTGSPPAAEILSSPLLASSSEGIQIRGDRTLIFDATPLFVLEVAPESGPAVVGDEFRYVLTYGNLGDVTPQSSDLTFVLPEATSFVSATDGGTFDAAEGSVSWDLSPLSPDSGGQVELTVLVDSDADEGATLEAVASIDPGSGSDYVLTSTAVSHVRETATDLDIQYAFAQNTLEPGGRYTLTLTAANHGDVPLSDVVAEVLLPSQINTVTSIFGETNFSCPGSACERNEIGIWDIGTLAPGEFTSIILEGSLRNDATHAGTVSSRLSAFSSENVQVLAGQDMSVDSTPLLRLHLAADAGPAVAGENHAYQIHIGNIGETTPTTPELRLQLPPGAGYVSDTAGGSHVDGTVTWNLGAIATDTGREIEVIVGIDPTLEDGDLLRATAELDSGINSEFDLQAFHLLSVAPRPDLHIDYTIDRSSSGLNGNTIYSITASNQGDIQLTDVIAQFVVPPYLQAFGSGQIFGEGDLGCAGTNCENTELATWTVGVLEPGQTRTVQFRTYPTGSPPAAEILSSPLLATSSEGIQVRADRTLIFDATPLFALDVAPETGPAVAGDEFHYTVSYGNIGDITPQASNLTFVLPPATSFVSATDGGEFDAADGSVTWDLSPLSPDAGGQVELVLLVDSGASDGTVLEAVASIDPGVGSDYVLTSTTVSHVRNTTADLDIQYAFAQSVLEPGGRYMLTLTATNHGDVQLSDVVAEVLLPAHLNTVTNIVGETSFTCPGGACERNEIGTWNIGTMAPGAFTSVVLEGALRNDATDAAVLSSRLSAFSSENVQVLAGQDMIVDGTPLLRLHLAGDPGPAVAGQNYAYQIHIGNIGTSTPTSSDLQLRLPTGVSFVSASGGGTESGGVVAWNLGALAQGTGEFFEVVTQVSGLLDEGYLLRAIAELDSGTGNEFEIRSDFVTPVVDSTPPLEVELLTVPRSGMPSQQLLLRANVRNTTNLEQADVHVRIVLPPNIVSFPEADPGHCPGSGCDPSEVVNWTLASLGPNQSQTLDMSTSFRNTAPLGEILRSVAVASSSAQKPALSAVSTFVGSKSVAVGACCLPDGSCILTSADQCSPVGVYQGDDVSCTPNPCPAEAEGACCAPDGSCSLTPASQCQDDYQGDDTTCDPNPCDQPTGACCAPDGSCSVTTAAECLDDYRGDGTICVPNPCEQPTGACCASDGSCSVTTAAECPDDYRGDGTICVPNPCEQPTGACCAPDGSCSVTTAAECQDDYRGDGTICVPNPCEQPTGACCAPDGSCSVTTAAECQDDYQGDETVCDPNPCDQPTGVCCFLDGSCQVLTDAACTIGGGTFDETRTACDPNPCLQPDPTGACCSSGTDCVIRTEVECTNTGGNYRGDGVSCAPDPCPPLPISILPTPGAPVSPFAPLIVLFDESVTGNAEWSVTVDGAPVSGDSKVIGSRVVFTPSAPFDRCDVVSAQLNGGIGDAAGNLAAPESWTFDVACEPQDVSFIQPPRSGRYTLMSVPVLTTGRASDLLSSLGEQGDLTWRAFGWTGSSYVEDPEVGPGDAFWIAGTEDVFDGSDLSIAGVPNGDAMRIELEQGWNLIGVPNPGQAADWSSVLVIADSGIEPLSTSSIVDQPCFYDDSSDDFVNNGDYTIADRVSSNPLGGYWAFARERCTLLFSDDAGLLPGVLVQAGNASSSSISSSLVSEWTVRFRATSGVWGDGGILIGTRTDARHGLDRTDVAKPPAFQSELTLAARVPGTSDPFLVSYQPPRESDTEWTLSVEGSPEFVDLHWSEVKPIPEGQRLYLFDEDARLLAEVTGEGSQRVVLRGSRELTLRATQTELETPTTTTQLRILPNPVQDVGQVHLQLETAKAVSLQIVDVSGRTVTKVHEGLLDAGAHFFDWEPATAGSGVYFLRGSVGSENIHTKILVIK